MAEPPVTVFGGTGFLGRRIVRRLLQQGCRTRVAVRRPEVAVRLFDADPNLETLAVDIRDPEPVRRALAGAGAAINAVSLYRERRGLDFESLHVEAAGRLAELARDGGLSRLVQLSGIGADPAADDAYLRSRGRGEAAVRAGFPTATLLRPSALVGEGDALIGGLASLVRRLPVVPLFGRGETRLQPAWVDDVAGAAVRAARQPTPSLELGGAEVWRYRELVEAVADRLGRHPRLLPVPFALWELLARGAERLPGAPLTRHQVALLRRDNLPGGAWPGFEAVGIRPRGLSCLLPELLAAKPGGRDEPAG